MIIDVSKDAIPRIRNVYLLYHILPGLLIREDFRQAIKNTGIELEEAPYRKEIEKRLDLLAGKGAVFRNNGKSIYLNRLSPACALCDKGEGALTVDVTHNCNRNCYHCFGDTSKIPKGQIYDYPGAVDAFAEMSEVRSMALSGGEPLLYKSHALNCLGYVDEQFPEAYKRLYTNGDFLDADVLRELQEVHLDEIRFSIKHTDFDDWSTLRKKIALSGDFIPNVMVEMPVMPGTLAVMKDILVQLDELEIFGINLCEFCYCMHHAKEYNERSYKAKFPPFKTLYLNRRQYPGIPVAGSDLESYDLLAFAGDRGLKIGVHYCSLENRLTSPIYEMNYGQADDPVGYFSQKDFFIKNAIVCGQEDILQVMKVFERHGVKDCRIVDGPAKYIEFHVGGIALLKDLDIDIGIVSSVMESDASSPALGREEHGASVKAREYGKRKRVVKIDLTHPGIFDFEKDV